MCLLQTGHPMMLLALINRKSPTHQVDRQLPSTIGLWGTTLKGCVPTFTLGTAPKVGVASRNCIHIAEVRVICLTIVWQRR